MKEAGSHAPLSQANSYLSKVVCTCWVTNVLSCIKCIASRNMKKRLISKILVLALVGTAASCASSRSSQSTRTPSSSRSSSSTGILFPGGISTQGHLPPGQAKKMNGDQSAKAYAPGQQKRMKKGKKPRKN